MTLLALNWDEVRGEIKKQGGGLYKEQLYVPQAWNGDKSKYLQNFNIETVRNLLTGRQAKKWKRYTLFREIMQRVATVPYRRFGTNYRSHLQGSIPGDQLK